MSLRFGLSKEDITPGFPTCLACSQKKDTLFKRIHDSIYVRCTVLCNDKHFIVILSYDLLFHSRELYDFVHTHVKSFGNINISDILINYTHNHNAPSVRGYNDFSSSDEYEKLLKTKTISALNKAFSDINFGSLEYGVIPGNWNINRRRPSGDGIKLAPNPNGPADKNMYVIKLLSSDNNLKGLVINYACHPVHYPDTLGLTSEYPGHLCKYLEEEYPNCLPIFIQGAGADTRPLGTVEGDHFKHCSYNKIEKMAMSMKDTLISNITSNLFSPIEPSFSSISFNIEIPFYDEGIMHFKKAIKDKNLSAHLRRNAEFIVKNYSKIKNSFTLECGLIKFSDNLMMAHMGGEPVCEVKFNIEKILNDYKLIFAGYTDACSYIVTDEMIEQGGYEVSCYLEYMHKGKIKKGINNLIASTFEHALLQLS